MGMLIDGEWHTDNPDSLADGGGFKRKEVTYRNRVTADGSPGPAARAGSRRSRVDIISTSRTRAPGRIGRWCSAR